MHILIVSQYFWPEPFRITDLAIGLIERGHKVTVLTGVPNYPQGKTYKGYKKLRVLRETHKGIDIVRVPLIARGIGSKTRLAFNYFSFIFNACVLVPFLRLPDFDVIFVYEPSPVTVGIPAILLRWLRRRPLFFWVQDLWPETLEATGVIRSQHVLSVVGHLVRFIYAHCDRILVQSQTFRQAIERQGVKPDLIDYFPNSAEGYYQPVNLDAEDKKHDDIPKGFVLMFAGNLGAAQDLPTIVSAAERLRDYADIHWVIFGDGRMRPWLEAKISERGLTGNVHLMGRVPANEMSGYYSLADVLLVTLKAEPIFAQTVPAKVQSYLASGKPILAALSGEGANIIRSSGAGLLAEPENVEQLAMQALRFKAMSESDRVSMGCKGRVYFDQHFNRELLLAKLERWMAEEVGLAQQ